jgi:hypothetical protein
MTSVRSTKVRAAQSRAALNGRRFNGEHDERRFYVGPTRQGVLLQPGAAAELSDLLAEAAMKAWTLEEAISLEATSALSAQ